MSGLAFRTYQDPTPDGPAFFRTQLLTELRADRSNIALGNVPVDRPFDML